MNSFIKDVFRVGLSKILIIAFGLATSIVTARYIGPEGNGIIAGITVYPTLFMSIGSLGIRQSTTYFLGKSVYPEKKIYAAITQIWLITAICSTFICFLLISYFSSYGSLTMYVLLALLPIPFTLFNTYSSGIFLGKNDIKTFNQINWIPSFLTFVFTALFVVLMKLGVGGAMLAITSGPLFMFGLLLLRNRFFKAFSFLIDWKIIKDMLSLGTIYAVSLLVINLNYKLDIILLDKLSTPYEIGIYTKGANITQYLWQIPMLFSTIVFARSATSKEDQSFSFKVAQLLRVSFLLVGLAAIILIAFSKDIILLMYGEQFRGSIVVLQYMIPGVVVLTVYKVMNMDLAGKGKPWVSMKSMIPSLIVNFLLDLYLIPKLASKGAAISSACSYTLAGLLFLYFYSKEVKISIKEILRYKKSDFDPLIKFVQKYGRR